MIITPLALDAYLFNRGAVSSSLTGADPRQAIVPAVKGSRVLGYAEEQGTVLIGVMAAYGGGTRHLVGLFRGVI